jgi:hypothetical protein
MCKPSSKNKRGLTLCFLTDENMQKYNTANQKENKAIMTGCLHDNHSNQLGDPKNEKTHHSLRLF